MRPCIPAVCLPLLFVTVMAPWRPVPAAQTASGLFPPELEGAWGTAEQCAVLRAGADEHPGKATYRIDADWIIQGLVHCQVRWLGSEQTGNGKRYSAMAQCGEDDLRDYRLSMLLNADGLSIRWSFDYVTPVLQRCR